MLYFRTQPDPVFIAFVKEALLWELQGVRRISSTNDCDAWTVGYPMVGMIFTPYSALITLEELLVVNETSTVYRPTDYHWLLLYECLKNFCMWHNDQVIDRSVSFTMLGGYRFGLVNFDTMTDRYFWDLEFMELLYSSAVEPEGCTCEESTEGSGLDLSYGLRPHPHTLRMSLVKETAWCVPEPRECGQWRLP